MSVKAPARTWTGVSFPSSLPPHFLPASLPPFNTYLPNIHSTRGTVVGAGYLWSKNHSVRVTEHYCPSKAVLSLHRNVIVVGT